MHDIVIEELFDKLSLLDNVADVREHPQRFLFDIKALLHGCKDKIRN